MLAVFDVGEWMFGNGGNVCCVIGYGHFVELIVDYEIATKVVNV